MESQINGKDSNSYFNDFLSENKSKIKDIVPKNPSIAQDDDWRDDDNDWNDLDTNDEVTEVEKEIKNDI